MQRTSHITCHWLRDSLTMSEKTKKQRTIYTPQQVCYLEEKFSEQDFPNKIERKRIADILQLSEQHVQVTKCNIIVVPWVLVVLAD